MDFAEILCCICGNFSGSLVGGRGGRLGGGLAETLYELCTDFCGDFVKVLQGLCADLGDSGDLRGFWETLWGSSSFEGALGTSCGICMSSVAFRGTLRGPFGTSCGLCGYHVKSWCRLGGDFVGESEDLEISAKPHKIPTKSPRRPYAVRTRCPRTPPQSRRKFPLKST